MRGLIRDVIVCVLYASVVNGKMSMENRGKR